MHLLKKENLEPCLHCGGRAELEDWLVGYESGTTIECVECGACVSESVVTGNGWHERAIMKWNRRHRIDWEGERNMKKHLTVIRFDAEDFLGVRNFIEGSSLNAALKSTILYYLESNEGPFYCTAPVNFEQVTLFSIGHADSPFVLNLKTPEEILVFIEFFKKIGAPSTMQTFFEDLIFSTKTSAGPGSRGFDSFRDEFDGDMKQYHCFKIDKKFIAPSVAINTGYNTVRQEFEKNTLFYDENCFFFYDDPYTDPIYDREGEALLRMAKNCGKYLYGIHNSLGDKLCFLNPPDLYSPLWFSDMERIIDTKTGKMDLSLSRFVREVLLFYEQPAALDELLFAGLYD